MIRIDFMLYGGLLVLVKHEREDMLSYVLCCGASNAEVNRTKNGEHHCGGAEAAGKTAAEIGRLLTESKVLLVSRLKTEQLVPKVILALLMRVGNDVYAAFVCKAEPVQGMTAAYKVTFFWPFYGGYYVSWLSPDYSMAIVTSDSHDYFWFLSRSPKVDQSDIDFALAKANEWGYDIDQMIVTQSLADIGVANAD